MKIQRQRNKSRNKSGVKIGIDNTDIFSSQTAEICYGKAKEKDKKIINNIWETNRSVMMLTQDIGDLDQRITATELKINVFIKPDYELVK